MLFNAACILSECGFCVCDIIGKILSKRGDNAYNVFVNIIETDLFKRFGYWMCNSNMSDESKYKLGLLYNNALRQEAMDNDNYIEFLFGVNTW